MHYILLQLIRMMRHIFTFLENPISNLLGGILQTDLLPAQSVYNITL